MFGELMDCKARLKNNKLPDQKLNVRYFLQATEHDMNVHAKFQYLIFYRFL
jgi:hypothetical protein